MSVRREIPEYDGIYFIIITCSQWLHLFELSNGYEEVYKWFDHLKSRGHFIVGYVIMPNHIHALIAFRNTRYIDQLHGRRGQAVYVVWGCETA